MTDAVLQSKYINKVIKEIEDASLLPDKEIDKLPEEEAVQIELKILALINTLGIAFTKKAAHNIRDARYRRAVYEFIDTIRPKLTENTTEATGLRETIAQSFKAIDMTQDEAKERRAALRKEISHRDKVYRNRLKTALKKAGVKNLTDADIAAVALALTEMAEDEYAQYIQNEASSGRMPTKTFSQFADKSLSKGISNKTIDAVKAGLEKRPGSQVVLNSLEALQKRSGYRHGVPTFKGLLPKKHDHIPAAIRKAKISLNQMHIVSQAHEVHTGRKPTTTSVFDLLVVLDKDKQGKLPDKQLTPLSLREKYPQIKSIYNRLTATVKTARKIVIPPPLVPIAQTEPETKLSTTTPYPQIHRESSRRPQAPSTTSQMRAPIGKVINTAQRIFKRSAIKNISSQALKSASSILNRILGFGGRAILQLGGMLARGLISLTTTAGATGGVGLAAVFLVILIIVALFITGIGPFSELFSNDGSIPKLVIPQEAGGEITNESREGRAHVQLRQGPDAIGSCPVIGTTTITEGSYNPINETGHGSRNYWSGSWSGRETCSYSIPTFTIVGNECLGPLNSPITNDNPCASDNGCPYYGLAADVAPIGEPSKRDVILPLICASDSSQCNNIDNPLSWTINNIIYNCGGSSNTPENACIGADRWGYGIWLTSGGNGFNEITIYLSHIDLDQTLSRGQQISSGTVIGTVLQENNVSHVHMELKLDGSVVDPVFLCEGVIQEQPSVEQTNTSIVGECPIENPQVFHGFTSYNPQTETGHGSNSYWQEITRVLGNEQCSYALPGSPIYGGRCNGPSPEAAGANNVCASQPSTCPYYGYAADFTTGDNPKIVNAPNICSREDPNCAPLIWTVGRIDNTDRGSRVILTSNHPNLGMITITLLHIEVEPFITQGTEVYAGEQIGTLSDELIDSGDDRRHVHIELNVGGEPVRPDFLCL